MAKFVKTTLLTLAGSALLIAGVHAQAEQTTTTKTTETFTTTTPPQPGFVPPQPLPSHPRIAEVDDRVDAISAHIGKLRHDDRIDGHEERNLRKRITEVQEQEQHFIAQDGGHLTPREQQILNEKLNRIELDLKHWKD